LIFGKRQAVERQNRFTHEAIVDIYQQLQLSVDEVKAFRETATSESLVFKRVKKLRELMTKAEIKWGEPFQERSSSKVWLECKELEECRTLFGDVARVQSEAVDEKKQVQLKYYVAKILDQQYPEIMLMHKSGRDPHQRARGGRMATRRETLHAWAWELKLCVRYALGARERLGITTKLVPWAQKIANEMSES